MMQASQRYAVYILASRRNGAPPVGVTNNIAASTYQHRTGAGGEFTCKYGMTRATTKRAWLLRRAKASSMSCFCICKRVSRRHEVRGLRLGQRQPVECLGHGVSLAEIEALFAGDVYVVRDTIVSGERRVLGFGDGAGRWIFCVFTWRGNRIRPVSVRFMHEKEVKLYVEEISRLEKR